MMRLNAGGGERHWRHESAGDPKGAKNSTYKFFLLSLLGVVMSRLALSASCWEEPGTQTHSAAQQITKSTNHSAFLPSHRCSTCLTEDVEKTRKKISQSLI